MSSETIDGVSVARKANVCFDGTCISHAITYANGTKKSLGDVLPVTLNFGTAAAETGPCHYIFHYA